MGTWQVRALALAAIVTGTVPVVVHVADKYLVHSLTRGVHVRVDLPLGLVAELRLEPAGLHHRERVAP